MGLGDIDPTNTWQFHQDADDDLVAAIDKHLPEHWKENPIHRRQVYRVVENFLQTAPHRSLEMREKAAREKTLEQEPVDAERTIADAVGRRLYTDTPYREKFRHAVRQIEQDYQ